MALKSAENLIKELKKEGSFPKYYDYLVRMYATQQAGSHYSLQNDACQIPLDGQDEFLEYALAKDLAHKSLTKLSWIAEAEREFTSTPHFTALDRYYRINPDTYRNKKEVQHAVRELEHIFSGKANLFEEAFRAEDPPH